jgi:hypothetical protein
MAFLQIDLTNERRDAALKRMLILLGERCDGAHRADHCGFNRDDAQWGRDVLYAADADSLEDCDYEDAAEILFKYWRQFPPALFNEAYGKGSWERLKERSAR